MNPGLCILQGLSFAIAPLRARRSPPLAPSLRSTVTREIPMNVDEIGRALGVEQAPDAEVRTSQELLHDRDQRR
jgi:hypothetical protein